MFSMTLKRLKMRQRILPLVALLLIGGCASIPPLSQAPDSGWRLFDVSKLRDYYYNPAAIERLSATVLKIPIATVVKGAEGRDWEVDQRMKRGLTFGGYENYYSSEDVYLIDCAQKRYQIISGTDYDEKGNILTSQERSNPSWESIPRGSALETLASYKSVCPE